MRSIDFFVTEFFKFGVFATPLLIIAVVCFEGYVRGYIPVWVFIPILFYFLSKISAAGRRKPPKIFKAQSNKNTQKRKPIKLPKFGFSRNSKGEYKEIAYEPKPKMPLQLAAIALGLSPSQLPTFEEVRKSYRNKMKTAHPDNGGSETLAKHINNARDILLEEIELRSRSRAH